MTLFVAACFLLAAVGSFVFFAALPGLSAIAIGLFKTGALALIGDLPAGYSGNNAAAYAVPRLLSAKGRRTFR